MQVDGVDPNQWLPYMPGLAFCKWLQLGAAKGRGTLDSDSCLVLSKLRGTLLSCHTIAALLVIFVSIFFQALLSVHDCLYLTPV